MLDSVVAFQVVFRTHEVAELESGYHAAIVVAAHEGLVHAAFECEREALADWEYETQSTTRPVSATLALQVSEVAFQVVVADDADCGAGADLIDDAEVSLVDQAPRNKAANHRAHFIDDRAVHEALRSEETHFAAAKQVIQSERRLA